MLTGLNAGTIYHYRMYGFNAAGQWSWGNDLSFTTASAVAPTVTTLAPTLITTTSAQLNGTINPNGRPTSYMFIYGKQTNDMAILGSLQSVGSGTSPVSVNAALSGLTPSTLYHIKLVGSGDSVVIGNDVTFTTAVGPPTVSGVLPSPVPTSTANQNITISGANFQTNCTLTFTDTSGGTFASVASKLTRNSTSQITYLFNNAGDAGTWKVKVNNPDGKSSDPFNFTVQIAAQPNLVVDSITFSPASVNSGGNFTLGFRVRNIGPGNAVATLARVRLSTDTTLTSSDLPLSPLDVSIPAIPSGSSYAFSGTITIPGSTPQGLYYVGAFADFDNRANQNNITDDAGISAARLTVNNTGVSLPTVSITPASQTVVSGGNVTFTAVVSGTGPFGYQWMHNGIDMFGSISSNMPISGVTEANAGSYKVRVSNPAGTVTSSAATVIVTPSTEPQPPVTASKPSNFTWIGPVDLSRPTVIITHGWQPPPETYTGSPPEWAMRMAVAISNRLDREGYPQRINGQRANIGIFVWPEAYNGFFPAAGYSFDCGSSLAKQLEYKLGPSYSGNIQFIGHSLGTFVNAAAVGLLPSSYRHIHVTTLDPPLRMTGFDQSWFHKLLPDNKVDWVDNYIGTYVWPLAFGEPISGSALNGGWSVSENHAGVHEFYYRTITNDNWTASGFRFSGIFGGTNRPWPPYWSQNPNTGLTLADIKEVLSFASQEGFRVINGAVEEISQSVNGQVRRALRLFKSVTGTKSLPRSGADVRVLASAGTVSSNSIIALDISIPKDANCLEFEFSISASGTGDWMTVEFNESQLFSFRGENFVGTNFHTAILPIGEYAGQSGILTFWLHGGSAAAASVTLSKFEFKAALGLNVAPASQAVGSAAGTTTFAVTNIGGGTMTYTASEAVSWLSIKSGGKGTNSGTITISYLANSNTTARTGTVTVTAAGVTGSPKSVTVIQAGKPVLSFSPSSRVHPAAAASGQVIAVTANIPWAATTNVPWITITSGNSGSGNGTVTYSISANGGAVRSGTIAVSGGGITRTFMVNQYPVPSFPAVSAVGDFDGDGAADAAIFQPSTGNWDLLFGAGIQWVVPFGWSAVIPVPADYDGDGTVDLAVYHPAGGKWYIRQSSAGDRVESFGWSATIPLPGDYDGDGRADLAVFYQKTAQWYLRLTSIGRDSNVGFGWSATIPVPADYDGDGATDLAVYHPAGAKWYVAESSTGNVVEKSRGGGRTLPVPADYDGDGKADAAVFYQGKWTITLSGSGADRVSNFGWSATLPVPADYDGDGKADLAVYHPAGAKWYVLSSQTGATLVKSLGGSDRQPVLLNSLIHSWFKMN